MTHPVAHRAAADLRAVREQWGDLLAAIESPPAAEWPPHETRGLLDHAAAPEHTEPDPLAHIGRTPLALRAHPAPLNLDALAAAVHRVRDLADRWQAVMRPGERHPAAQALLAALDGTHRYVSIYCVHGNCGDCRLTCKTCHAPCLHDCHQGATADGSEGPADG